MRRVPESIDESMERAVLHQLPDHLRTEVLALIQALRAVEGEEKFYLREIWIFGSHARSEARLDSDVDILVLIDDRCSAKNPALLARRAIAKSNACLPYDLLVLRWSDWQSEKANRWTCYPDVERDRKLLYAR
ncbi:MAG TPA: nucleotidyltransferase domain-containing protein [Candidatus Methylacidiphilales bacterium]|jgi:predicted nucleotidyltransferase|nr:nucleotidyltransferase domain-containing protein [Candidatus Methylacidiphilales bacterium]